MREHRKESFREVSTCENFRKFAITTPITYASRTPSSRTITVTRVEDPFFQTMWIEVMTLHKSKENIFNKINHFP
jgi:hypothetical protein